jgi:Tannase-like family of unknown function (DUF6351)
VHVPRPGEHRALGLRRTPADAPTTFIAERQTLSSEPDSECNALFPSWTFPRHIAGGPVAANIMKCSLKPIRESDYKVAFSPAEMARLRSIFPQGVCG